MADVDIRDLSGNVLVAFARAFRFPWPRGSDPNVILDLTVGWMAFAERLGASRKTIQMAFQLLGPQQAAEFRHFVRQYGGGAQPFLLHFGGSYSRKFDGSRKYDGSWIFAGNLRCRYPGKDPVELTNVGLSAFACAFIEDLV